MGTYISLRPGRERMLHLHNTTIPTFTPPPTPTPPHTQGHFLLANLLLGDLKAAPSNSPAGAPRLIIVGSITGNTNTLAGNVPPKADLGDLSGLASKQAMIDGGEFNGAKAYKDSKVGARRMQAFELLNAEGLVVVGFRG